MSRKRILQCFSIPWPPSVNHIYGIRNNRRYIKEGGVKFKRKVFEILADKTPIVTAKLAISLYAHPPDNRKRDLDNLLKLSLDAIEFSGLVKNDFMFSTIVIQREDVVKDGRIDISIWTRDDA